MLAVLAEIIEAAAAQAVEVMLSVIWAAVLGSWFYWHWLAVNLLGLA
jgi:hypothetical protein